MSKKTKKHKSNRELSRRNNFNIANPLNDPQRLLRRSLPINALRTLSTILDAQRRKNLWLSELEDARRHRRAPHIRRYRTITGETARIKNTIRFKRLSPALVFSTTRNVIVCVRRRRRREVLFATKNAGRGGSQKKHKRNSSSALICRRRRK